MRGSSRNLRLVHSKSPNVAPLPKQNLLQRNGSIQKFNNITIDSEMSNGNLVRDNSLLNMRNNRSTTPVLNKNTK